MRKRAVGLAILVAIALTGCVGIPTSGGVNDGAVIDDQGTPEFVVLPKDPVPGSSQEEILADFLQAVRGPQNGYAIAKKYLTSKLSETWNPDANALIRTGSPVTSVAGQDSLAYTVTSRANVNELGQYTEERDEATQTLTYTFAREGGEWRISGAPDGIVLSQSSFNVAFREQALYFFDPSFSYLVPDVRWFPSRTTSANRVVQALLAGPSSWMQQSVVTAFPPATTLVDISAQSQRTAVDLSSEALTSTAQERDRMRQQLVAALSTPNIALTVRGLDLTIPDASGDRAVVNPTVDSAPLVGSPTEFGFAGSDAVTPIPNLTPQLVGAGAVSADLASDKQTATFLSGDGRALAAAAGVAAPTVVDARAGLVAPALDPFRFVWSAQRASAASLTAFELDGTPHALQSGLPADNSVVSVDVSRDGTRVLLGLVSPVGPRLVVAGIIRQNTVPLRLGELVDLPVGSATPLDATWADDRTVVQLASDAAGGVVTAFELGGPSTQLGRVADATTIAGGRSGVDGLRALAADGTIWRPRGSEGWVSTGLTAGYLGTKQ